MGNAQSGRETCDHQQRGYLNHSNLGSLSKHLQRHFCVLSKSDSALSMFMDETDSTAVQTIDLSHYHAVQRSEDDDGQSSRFMILPNDSGASSIAFIASGVDEAVQWIEALRTVMTQHFDEVLSLFASD